MNCVLEAIRCAEAMRPWVVIMIIILGARFVWLIGWAVYATRQRHWPWAWRISVKLSGWRSLLATLGLLAAFLLLNRLPDMFTEVPVLQTPHLAASLIPLTAGVISAFVFSPEDEPGLEATLTRPRPLAYLLLERWLLVLVQQGAVAVLVGSIGIWLTGRTDRIVALTDWFIPTLVLIGVATSVTLITRQAVFGAALSGLVWWAMLFFADGTVAARPYLWPLHLYLSPRHPGFALNRALLLLLGLQLLALALHQLRDETRLAWGVTRRSTARLPAVMATASANRSHPPINSGLMLRLYQLGALIVYEARMQWRRRTMLAVLVWPVALAILLAFAALKDLGGQALTASTAVTQHQIALALMVAAWLPIYVGIVVVTAVVAEVIPRDRQLGIGDMLDALPLTPGVYLMGKVLSVCVGLLGLLGGAMLTIGAVWWWVLGPFEVSLYVRMWVGGAAPLAVLNSGLVVLLAANLANRRQAAVVGLTMTLVCIATMFVTFPNPWLNALSPARSALLRYFLRETTPMLAASATREHVLWAWGVGGLELALAWGLAWLGKRRQEAYA